MTDEGRRSQSLGAISTLDLGGGAKGGVLRIALQLEGNEPDRGRD